VFEDILNALSQFKALLHHLSYLETLLEVMSVGHQLLPHLRTDLGELGNFHSEWVDLLGLTITTCFLLHSRRREGLGAREVPSA
jgi:hypothetical protein